MKSSVKPITPFGFRARKFSILFIFSSLAIFGAVYFLFFCRVKLVTIENENVVSEIAILDAAEIKKGQHLYAINEGKIERAVIAENPYVKSVSVNRKLPSTLQISVEEYNLAYYVEYAEQYYLLTDELLVLEMTTPEKAAAKGAIPLMLPKFKDPSATTENPNPPKVLSIGETVVFYTKSDFAWSKTLLNAIENTDFAEKITKIDLSDPFSLKLEVSGQYTILLGNERDFEKKLARVERALSYLEENMTALTGILHAEQDAPVTFSFTGVIAENSQ